MGARRLLSFLSLLAGTQSFLGLRPIVWVSRPGEEKGGRVFSSPEGAVQDLSRQVEGVPGGWDSLSSG